jgi:hypothetical protein
LSFESEKPPRLTATDAPVKVIFETPAPTVTVAVTDPPVAAPLSWSFSVAAETSSPSIKRVPRDLVREQNGRNRLALELRHHLIRLRVKEQKEFA